VTRSHRFLHTAAVPPTVPPPNRIPWPPLIFIGAAVAAFALGHVAAAPEWLDIGVAEALGWVTMALALGLDVAAVLTLRRHETNVLPNRPATRLVTTGVYSWSRNPIYLGNTLLLAGAAFAFRNPWFLPAAAGAGFAVLRLAVLREERHLAARFGAAWEDYRSRTGRWFGRRSDD
jgi:protein-S-isoprenylcysteine O-methyltransferase Ste14